MISYSSANIFGFLVANFRCCSFVLAALFEGHNHPIFDHVGDCVVDIAEPADKIPKRLIGLLDACEQIVLMTGATVHCWYFLTHTEIIRKRTELLF